MSGVTDMKINYAILPETYKLTVGLKHLFNTEMINEMPKTATVPSAKNSTAAVQLLFSCDERVSVSLGNAQHFPQHPCRSLRLKASSSDTSLSFIDTVLDDDMLLKADIISNAPVKEFEANEPIAIYAETYLPSDASIGKKNISIDFFLSDMLENEETALTAGFTVEVYDYSMPSGSEMPFFLDLWQHSCSVARYYNTVPWSDRHFEILESFLRPLAEIGQKAVTLILSDAPWSGQWCRREERYKANFFEYSIVSVFKNSDGSFDYDFTAMQRYIDLCARLGIRDEISLYGLVNIWCDPYGGFERLAPDHPDGLRVRYLDRDTGRYGYLRSGEQIDSYIKAIYEYFKERDLLDRVRLVADEPADPKAYRAAIDRIKAIAPEFKLKAAINHSEFISEFSDSVKDFVPYIRGLSKEFDKISEFKHSMKNSRFLWYVCCDPTHPNTLLHSDLNEALFIGVLTSYLELDGFLRWSYCLWTEEPTRDIRYYSFPCGDICFVYPGKDASPLLSLRFKALAKGIRLAVLLNEYKARFGRQAAEQLYDGVILEKDIGKYFEADGRPVALEKMCSLGYESYAELEKAVLSALADG